MSQTIRTATVHDAGRLPPIMRELALGVVCWFAFLLMFEPDNLLSAIRTVTTGYLSDSQGADPDLIAFRNKARRRVGLYIASPIRVWRGGMAAPELMVGKYACYPDGPATPLAFGLQTLP